MNIIKAAAKHLEMVQEITCETIKTIYPHYYAKGAVDFFLAHHSSENILRDIQSGIVFLLCEDERMVGTVTIKNNEICRLFVLPQYQKCGYGKALLDFAEQKIAEQYDVIILDASLPAKGIYQKRGFVEMETKVITTENGDLLCYDEMRKYCSTFSRVTYDNKIFVPKVNSENGEVDGQTRFAYHQKGNMIWAEYSGGEIEKGFLIGTVDVDGNLDFTYQHLNTKMQVRIGKCHSIPTILSDGKIELHEEWQWLNGDKSKGSSVLVEWQK